MLIADSYLFFGYKIEDNWIFCFEKTPRGEDRLTIRTVLIDQWNNSITIFDGEKKLWRKR